MVRGGGGGDSDGGEGGWGQRSRRMKVAMEGTLKKEERENVGGEGELW